MPEVYIIIYLDLVAYSKNNELIQISLFKNFQRELNHILYDDIINNDCILIPTGDGMIIGIKHDKEKSYLTSINMIIEIINWAKKNNTKLRSSLHIGDVNLLIDINKNKNIVGNTINDAARMLSGAENDSIIVSKTFFDKFLRQGSVCIGTKYAITENLQYIIADEDTIIDKHSFEHNVYNILFIKNNNEYGNRSVILNKYFTNIFSSDYPKKKNLEDSFSEKISNCTELILFGIYHPNTPKIIKEINTNNIRDVNIKIYYASNKLENQMLEFFNTDEIDYKIPTKQKSIEEIYKLKNSSNKIKIQIYEYEDFFPFGFSVIDKDMKGSGFIHFSSYLNGIMPKDSPYIEVEYKTKVYPPLYKFYKDYIERIFTEYEFKELKLGDKNM